MAINAAEVSKIFFFSIRFLKKKKEGGGGGGGKTFPGKYSLVGIRTELFIES